MTGKQIIRSSREKVGITSDRELMNAVGMSYSTYTHQRTADEGSWMLREMRAVIKATKMSHKDVLSWVLGREVSAKELME